MKETKNLTLRFNCTNGKKYNLRIADANQHLSSNDIQNAIKPLIAAKVFDFDGKGSTYTLGAATYTTTDKEDLLKA